APAPRASRLARFAIERLSMSVDELAESVAMRFTIRPADAADIPAITAIYGEGVSNGTASFELTPPSSDEMARRFASLCDAGYPWLAAAHDERGLGYAYASPYRPRPG